MPIIRYPYTDSMVSVRGQMEMRPAVGWQTSSIGYRAKAILWYYVIYTHMFGVHSNSHVSYYLNFLSYTTYTTKFKHISFLNTISLKVRKFFHKVFTMIPWQISWILSLLKGVWCKNSTNLKLYMNSETLTQTSQSTRDVSWMVQFYPNVQRSFQPLFL